MICKPCQLAADIIQFAPDGNTQPTILIEFQDVSSILHTECKGGTHCDCQHYPAGSMINATLEERNKNQENSTANSGVLPEAGN